MYTQAFSPLIVMSSKQDYLAVRCYVDEILIARLPPPERIRAQMLVHGTDIRVPLEFVRVQRNAENRAVQSPSEERQSEGNGGYFSL